MGKISRQSYRGLTHDQWLNIRRQYSGKGMVGGSDIGTIMHMNEYKSARELWYEMCGMSNPTFEGNEATMHGHHLEGYIADCFRYYDGDTAMVRVNRDFGNIVNQIRNYNYIVTNTDFPAQFANIDRRITSYYNRPGKPGVLECKNMRGYVHDKYEGGLPPQYLLQVQNYMAILEQDYAVIAKLVDGAQLHFYEIDRSDSVITMIKETAIQFQEWVMQGRDMVADAYSRSTDVVEQRQLADQMLVMTGPDIVESDAVSQFLSAGHALRANTYEMMADDKLKQVILMRQALFEHKKVVESSIKMADNIVRDIMNTNEVSKINLGFDGVVTWFKQLRYSIKSKINDFL